MRNSIHTYVKNSEQHRYEWDTHTSSLSQDFAVLSKIRLYSWLMNSRSDDMNYQTKYLQQPNRQTCPNPGSLWERCYRYREMYKRMGAEVRVLIVSSWARRTLLGCLSTNESHRVLEWVSCSIAEIMSLSRSSMSRRRICCAACLCPPKEGALHALVQLRCR